MWGSRDLHFEMLGPPVISPERLKLEISNLAQRWIAVSTNAVSTNEKNAKLGQKWSREGHVTHFWNFWTPLISRGRMNL